MKDLVSALIAAIASSASVSEMEPMARQKVGLLLEQFPFEPES